MSKKKVDVVESLLVSDVVSDDDDVVVKSLCIRKELTVKELVYGAIEKLQAKEDVSPDEQKVIALLSQAYAGLQ